MKRTIRIIMILAVMAAVLGFSAVIACAGSVTGQPMISGSQSGSGEDITVNWTVSNAPDKAACVVVARYEESGKLADTKIAPASNTVTSGSISFTKCDSSIFGLYLVDAGTWTPVTGVYRLPASRPASNVAPALSEIKGSVSEGTATLEFKADKPGKLYYEVKEYGEEAPSTEDILANGSSAAFESGDDASAAIPLGNTSGRKTVYIVTTDADGNVGTVKAMDTATSDEFNTENYIINAELSLKGDGIGEAGEISFRASLKGFTLHEETGGYKLNDNAKDVINAFINDTKFSMTKTFKEIIGELEKVETGRTHSPVEPDTGQVGSPSSMKQLLDNYDKAINKLRNYVTDADVDAFDAVVSPRVLLQQRTPAEAGISEADAASYSDWALRYEGSTYSAENAAKYYYGVADDVVSAFYQLAVYGELKEGVSEEEYADHIVSRLQEKVTSDKLSELGIVLKSGGADYEIDWDKMKTMVLQARKYAAAGDANPITIGEFIDGLGMTRPDKSSTTADKAEASFDYQTISYDGGRQYVERVLNNLKDKKVTGYASIEWGFVMDDQNE